MNERINDKIGISNTKLSFSEIAFKNKVINTLEPVTFQFVPNLLPFLFLFFFLTVFIELKTSFTMLLKNKH